MKNDIIMSDVIIRKLCYSDYKEFFSLINEFKQTSFDENIFIDILNNNNSSNIET